MIEITFNEFYLRTYPQEEFHELYIVKNSLGEVLYVGISNQDIWYRWFGWNGHIKEGDSYLLGKSAVGEKVVDHLPNSWDWKIQLWTLEDCVKFCSNELNPNGRYSIKMLESFMIQKFRPSLNIMMNLNPGQDSMPKSQREIEREKLLDKAYRDVFEKKD